VDASLESYWLEMIGQDRRPGQQSERSERDLLDGWTGLLWIPPTAEERASDQTPPIDRIERGLQALHKAVGDREDGEAILRYAIRQLDEAHPRSPEFWRATLAPRLGRLALS
jgi:hypothetical protein